MGWLKLGARSTNIEIPATPILDDDLKCATEHIETVSIGPKPSGIPKSYPAVSADTPDERLPFISAEEVKQRNAVENGGLFIVVDNIVFDCTNFLKKHPGGEQIIKSFRGAECSWQFWRFHGKKEMEEFGRPLRIGRTEGMVNKFKEPQKYVGLRKLGVDDWD
ncbi:cytochrome b5 [Stipitochalara longipes BDJ]|nr:cytochrome b5 [Stipitochalara longipes BDJ]